MLRIIIVTALIFQSTLILAQSGLKKVNYEDETADLQSSKTADKNSASLTPEQLEQAKKDIEQIKAKQVESQKILEELDKED